MKKLIYFFLFVALLNNACSKKLELNPIGSISSENFYKTQSDAEAAIVACYNGLIYQVGDGGWMVSGLDLWGDVLSSDMEPHADIVSWQQLQQYTSMPDNNNIRAEWVNIYQGIFRCNQALEKIPEIEMDETLKTRLLKEAKFLRGWWTFRLGKLFGNAPLVTTTLKVDELYIPKVSRQELFAQAETDLKEAVTLPDVYDDAGAGRATSASARTTLAELYMWQEKWTDAEAQLQPIITSGRFGLIDSYTSLFDGTSENTKETIFEIQYKANTGKDIGNFSTTQSAPNGEGYVNGGGWGWRRPTQDIINEYETTPKEDPRLTYSVFRIGDDFEGQVFEDVVNGTGYATKKWCISGKNGVEVEENFGWQTSANFALYRYAEVLLFYAEVLNELDRPADAIPYINQVRARPSVDMPALSLSLNKEQVFEAIRHERRIELAFEGKTGIDLRRWGIAGEFLRSPDRWQNNISINPQWGGNFFKFVDGKNEILPVPQLEIDRSNGTLEQNPNY